MTKQLFGDLTEINVSDMSGMTSFLGDLNESDMLDTDREEESSKEILTTYIDLTCSLEKMFLPVI